MNQPPAERTTPPWGEAEAFLQLYSQYERQLYLYIIALVPNPIDAHDVLQDTCVVLWEKFDRFETGSNFLAWAREIARYRVLRYRQINGGRTTAVAPELLEALAARAATRDDSWLDARQRALQACLRKLPAADQQLIEQRYTPRFSVKQFAAQSGRSENAISQALGRIRRVLKQCISHTLLLEEREELQ